MSMGCRGPGRDALIVSWRELPCSPGHAFYDRLQRVLTDAGFDAFVESVCAPFYGSRGSRSIPPGRYFRMHMVGYFEGIDSERGLEWRCSDSLSLRAFEPQVGRFVARYRRAGRIHADGRRECGSGSSSPPQPSSSVARAAASYRPARFMIAPRPLRSSRIAFSDMPPSYSLSPNASSTTTPPPAPRGRGYNDRRYRGGARDASGTPRLGRAFDRRPVGSSLARAVASGHYRAPQRNRVQFGEPFGIGGAIGARNSYYDELSVFRRLP